jgi:hypothetical protein
MDETAGIYGVITGHAALCLPMRRVPGTAVKLDSGIPLSVSGHFVDIASNSNKGYALQVVVMPDGTEEFHGYYGRIGGTFQRSPARDPSAFLVILSSKFGVRAAMSDLITGRLQGGPKKYHIDYYEIAPQPTTAVASTPAILGSGCPSGALTPNPAEVKSILDPRVERLLGSVLSTVRIKRSMAATVENLSFSISGDAVPTSEATAAARAAYIRGMAAWARYPDPTAYPIVLDAFGDILRNIAMRISGSAYTRASDAASDRNNWHRIGQVIDLIEQATLSLRAAGTSVPLASAPEWAASSASVDPSNPANDVRNFLYPGIFSGAVDSQGRAVTGVFLRPAPSTGYVKQRVADLSRDPLAARYAALACDVVPGNDFDRRICEHFVSQSETAKGFECYSIYPFSNDAKAPNFAAGKSALLVHGTSLSSVAAILGSQLDIKHCSGGRVGAKRIYAADDIRKSEQYASVDRREDGLYRYFFVIQCLIPETVKTITEDLAWNNVELDPNVLIYADGTRSRGAIYEVYNGAPQAVPLTTLLNADLADAARGFFGDSNVAIVLPGQPMIRLGHRASFDFAEYTFGSNDNIAIRYIIEVKY